MYTSPGSVTASSGSWQVIAVILVLPRVSRRSWRHHTLSPRTTCTPLARPAGRQDEPPLLRSQEAAARVGDRRRSQPLAQQSAGHEVRRCVVGVAGQRCDGRDGSAPRHLKRRAQRRWGRGIVEVRRHRTDDVGADLDPGGGIADGGGPASPGSCGQRGGGDDPVLRTGRAAGRRLVRQEVAQPVDDP